VALATNAISMFSFVPSVYAAHMTGLRLRLRASSTIDEGVA
jgi:hypothetical protein